MDYNQFNSILRHERNDSPGYIFQSFFNTEFHISLRFNIFSFSFGVGGKVTHVSDNNEEVLKKFLKYCFRVIRTIWIWFILEQFTSVYRKGFQKAYCEY